MAGPWIQMETRAGEPVTAGGNILIPMARVLRVMLPGMPAGGLIWNRPSAVVVRSADGQEQVLPVRDVTRQAQWALFGVALALLLPALLLRRRR